MVKIRLARIGEKKVPIYRIVVQESSVPRNGKTIDSIGYYDPNTSASMQRRQMSGSKRALSRLTL